MAPQRLLRGVPLDPLGAAVPADDPAVGIEHQDRVVLDALHQQLKTLTLHCEVPLAGPALDPV